MGKNWIFDFFKQNSIYDFFPSQKQTLNDKEIIKGIAFNLMLLL